MSSVKWGKQVSNQSRTSASAVSATSSTRHHPSATSTRNSYSSVRFRDRPQAELRAIRGEGPLNDKASSRWGLDGSAPNPAWCYAVLRTAFFVDCGGVLILSSIAIFDLASTAVFVYLGNSFANGVFFGIAAVLLKRNPELVSWYSPLAAVGFAHICAVLSLTCPYAGRIEASDGDGDGLLWGEHDAGMLICALLIVAPLGARISLVASLTLNHFAAIVYLVSRVTATQDLGHGHENAIVGALQLYMCSMAALLMRRSELTASEKPAKGLASVVPHQASEDVAMPAVRVEKPKTDPTPTSPSERGDASTQKTVPSPTVRPLQLSALPEAQLAVAPNRKLALAMAGQTAKWEVIENMAERIRLPDYSLSEYFDDCITAFPELQLFFTTSPDGEGKPMPGQVTSALGSDKEYQRTMGAMFAVYFLLRLQGDGKLGLSYGVDHEWVPIKRRRGRRFSEASVRRNSITSRSLAMMEITSSVDMTDDQKRASFCEAQLWDMFEDLIQQAGIDDWAPRSTQRIVAILCLTAFHDIMKIEDLLPTVKPEHGKYMGHKPGDVIRDHDIALSYVMEYYPELLPSYAGLPPEEKKVVLFTQGKMHFNHGWFVQGEAPPGANLVTLKQVLAGSESADLFFYFLHWFTDLAGAEGRPLAGAEKFVLRFRHSVLASFLWSIPYLGQLSRSTETQVMESYLKARWQALAPDMDIPEDSDAVAFMRLAVMAQADVRIVDVFLNIPPQDQSVLAAELARTGCKGQRFSSAQNVSGGPALLIYYAPALIQKNVQGDLYTTLRVLAEVMRTARALWPVDSAEEGSTVTIQIAALKEKDILEVTEMSESHVFVLVRHNDLEGDVMRKTVQEVAELRAQKVPLAEVNFAGCLENDESECSSENSRVHATGSYPLKVTTREAISASLSSKRGSAFPLGLNDGSGSDALGMATSRVSLCAVTELADMRQQNWLLQKKSDALAAEVSRLREKLVQSATNTSEESQSAATDRFRSLNSVRRDPL